MKGTFENCSKNGWIKWKGKEKVGIKKGSFENCLKAIGVVLKKKRSFKSFEVKSQS